MASIDDPVKETAAKLKIVEHLMTDGSGHYLDSDDDPVSIIGLCTTFSQYDSGEFSDVVDDLAQDTGPPVVYADTEELHVILCSESHAGAYYTKLRSELPNFL